MQALTISAKLTEKLKNKTMILPQQTKYNDFDIKNWKNIDINTDSL